MTADFSIIRQALEKALAAISGLPQKDGANAIAWENGEFDPGEINSWIRARIEPIEQKPGAVGVDAAIKHTGLFLIDCFIRTQTGQAGPLAADELAQKIQDAIPAGRIITESGQQIRIRFSERAGGVYDPPWYFVPLTIEWYSYIA